MSRYRRREVSTPSPPALSLPVLPGAACAEPGLDAELWFPQKGAHGLNSGRIAQAIAICNTCPVQAACAEWALSQHVEGIWGGLTRNDRLRERRRRREAAA